MMETRQELPSDLGAYCDFHSRLRQIFAPCVGAIVALATALGCATASATLTGQYLFEEGSGTDALDTSGFLRNGVETNAPVYVTGLYAGSTSALRFNSDGTTANQTLAQKIVLPGGTNFISNAPGASLTAWVRLEGTTTNNRTIISVANADATASGGGGASRATIQVVNSGGNAQVRALGRKDDTGGSSNTTSGSTFLTPGTTYFIAGVFDYVGSGIRLYINGTQVGSTTVAAWTSNSANSANLTAAIGTVSAPAATQEYFTGTIDGARIFNTALSAEQVLGLFNNPDSVPNPLTPGDTNGDGLVDINIDLKAIRDHYLQTVNMRSLGDLDDNQIVNFADFRNWKTAFLGGGGSLDGVDLSFSSVPEPTSLFLGLLGVAAATMVRSRRSNRIEQI